MVARRYGEWSEEEMAAARRMLADGKDVADIARQLERRQTEIAARIFALRRSPKTDA
jgi:hypothetical protein